jgi:hypothetical protein
MIQHYGGIFLDQFFSASASLLKVHSSKTVIQAPIIDSEWDIYYSFLFSIDVIYSQHKVKSQSSFKLSAIPSDLNLKIYSAFHIPIPLDHFKDISPLVVGGNAEYSQYLSDILKDGSYLNNARWSELSGIFKIWKEAPSAYVGFCHYRRIFDLRCQEPNTIRSTRISLGDLPREATLLGDSFLKLLDKDTIITPHPKLLNRSIFDQYQLHHKINDLCLTLSILDANFPELSEFTPIVFDSYELYANNMFITSWKNFDEICQIWFTVLTIFEYTVNNNGQNRYQRRDISFLAERIFTIWIHYKKHQGLKLKHCHYFHIDYPGLSTKDWSSDP